MVAPTLPAPTMVILLRRCTAAAMPGRLRVMTDSFRHVDAARTVVFGEGALEEAAGLLGDGYVLLATRRGGGGARPVRAGRRPGAPPRPRRGAARRRGPRRPARAGGGGRRGPAGEGARRA